MNIRLSFELKQPLVDHLKEFKDVFAQTYAEMPKLDLQLVTHKLNIREEIWPAEQASRSFWLELEVHIKLEIISY